jgi:oxygen-independent coproporphyrinogen III oxidase
MIREFVLQLKRGSIRPSYFAGKYNVDVRERFRDQLASLGRAGLLAPGGDDLIAITRDALLRVDTLLPRFFLPQHTGIRYT